MLPKYSRPDSLYAHGSAASLARGSGLDHRADELLPKGPGKTMQSTTLKQLKKKLQLNAFHCLLLSIGWSSAVVFQRHQFIPRI